MKNPLNARLALFLTQGMSLRLWEKNGSLSREILIYKRLTPYFKSMIFFTYGDETEEEFSELLHPIQIVWGLGKDREKNIRICTEKLVEEGGRWILKSNQFKGSDLPAGVAQKTGHPFVLRMGFGYSHFAEKMNQHDLAAIREAESQRTRTADRIVVTADFMKSRLIQDYSLAAEKVWVVPNFVSDWFFEDHWEDRGALDSIVTVARCDEQKNPFALLNAVKEANKKLTWIGNGALFDSMTAFAKGKNIALTQIKQVPNSELPGYFKRHDLFVMPSHYEGHPKALIEAMSFGMPCIGTRVDGTKDVIEDNETGLFCDPNADSLAKAIQTLERQSELRKKIAVQARLKSRADFHVDVIVKKELSVYEELLETISGS